MSTYQDMTIEDIGCSPDDAVIIEHIMREDIFHSTLDWQTRAQLCRAAKKAARILAENRNLYEVERAYACAILEEMQQAAAQKLRA